MELEKRNPSYFCRPFKATMKTFPILLFSLLLFSCGLINPPVQSRNERPTTTDSTAQASARKDTLRNQLRTISEASQGTLGVAILNLENQDTLNFNGHMHFPMQSVFKFPLAMAVLHQVDRGTIKPDASLHFGKTDLHPNTWSPIFTRHPQGFADVPLFDVLRFTVTQSDNNGCDRLFSLIGGPDTLNNFVHHLGVSQIQIKATEAQMHTDWDTQFTNWAEPLAMMQLLKILFQGSCLSPASNDTLLKLMTETETGVKRIKGLLPPGTLVAHKTGSGPTNKAGITSATNDVGIITLPNRKHVALVVFLMNSAADETSRELTLARVARATYDYAVKK